MAEYIDRDAALREIERREARMVGDKRVSFAAMKSFIKNRPATDVAPVRHGRWMKAKNKKDYWGFDSDGDFGCWSDYPVLCSSCKYDVTENSTGETNYCPNCGAKMNGGDSNADSVD